MIYTSYFGNIRKILSAIPDAGLISIAGKTPAWFNGKKYVPLMPHFDWWIKWHEKYKNDLNSEASRFWYASMYRSTVLKDLDKGIVARELKDLANWRPTFILCYETPEKFCHRHIVADWLKTGSGIQCEEWNNDNAKYYLKTK